jgi:hypothetical protein
MGFKRLYCSVSDECISVAWTNKKSSKGASMNIEDIFTDAELALIDSGKYMPGRAVLDAKLDLAAAMEREACAKVCDELHPGLSTKRAAEIIRAREQA